MLTQKNQWQKVAGVKGLRFRMHPDRTRKKGIKIENDVLFQYRHTAVDPETGKKKRLEEKIGWLFEGWTLEKAITRTHELKENKQHGTGPETLKAKRAARRKLEAEQQKRDTEQQKQNVTFSEIWEKYLPYCKAKRSYKHGWNRELGLFDRHIKPEIGALPLVDIKAHHLDAIKQTMASDKNPAGRPLSPRSINYALDVTRQVFNYAIRAELFKGKNPVANVERPSADNRRNRFFSHQEAEALLNELTENKHHDVFGMALLSFRCGLRASEIFRLKWGSVDFANGQIAIMDTKSGSNRFAILTEDVKALLRERFHKIDPADRNPQTLVFSRDGKPYFEMPRAFQRTVDEMGFNDNITDRRLRLVFHSCRHSFASWHAAAGTDLHVLQKLLGHETFSMVLRYAHLQPTTLKAAVKALEHLQQTEKNGAEVVNLDAYR